MHAIISQNSQPAKLLVDTVAHTKGVWASLDVSSTVGPTLGAPCGDDYQYNTHTGTALVLLDPCDLYSDVAATLIGQTCSTVLLAMPVALAAATAVVKRD